TGTFHTRRSNGNGNSMDIDEIRNAFNLSETYIERIKNFRKERIEILSNSETHPDAPVILEHYPHLVLHLVPLTIGNSNYHVSLHSINFATEVLGEFEPYYNLDGILIPISKKVVPEGIIGENDALKGYYQVFHSGTCEFITPLLNYPHRIDFKSLGGLKGIEDEAKESLAKVIQHQQNLK